jgi:hypothetical protein
MIDRKEFFTKLYEKITDAIKQCDEGNVIDLRLFKNGNCLGDGEFSIFEGEELYNEVKDCKEWYVDFYENIKGENRAEFVDIVLHSKEFKVDITPMCEEYNTLSLLASEYESKRRKQVANIIETLQKHKMCDYLVFTDKTSYPTFWDNTINGMETIVGAKAVDGVLFITSDATFNPMSWFDWTQYGQMDLDEFVYIVKQTLA